MSYTIYGWGCSPFSEKVRSYAAYKGLPNTQPQTHYLVMRKTAKKVGRVIMPVLEAPSGEFVQDTSVIIDFLENAHPDDRSIRPQDPGLRVLASLLEIFGDEWLPMLIMHHRWNNPENAKALRKEFAAEALPLLPSFLRGIVGSKISGKMESYLPLLGVHPHTEAAIEEFSEEFLTALDRHFSQHDYLLGGRPCIGDFAFQGPLYAQLYRDPGSLRLFEGLPHLTRWVVGLHEGAEPTGPFLTSPPDTLAPVWKRLLGEAMPWWEKSVEAVQSFLADNPEATRIRQGMGLDSFQVGNATGTRMRQSYHQWMLQRVWAELDALEPEDKVQILSWLGKHGPIEWASKRPPRLLGRKHHRVVPVPAA